MSLITIAHGSGGMLTHELIQNLFIESFGNDILNKFDDSALFSLGVDNLAFTVDSFVIKPLFFPGGDIGKLAVCGTVNDLAVAGAIPQYLSCSFIIEEGFEQSDLKRVVTSMAIWSRKAGVKIVTGDTKVVERGSADGIFITTSGIGLRDAQCNISQDNIKVGDKIIVTGTIGDHGVAVLSKRKGLSFDSDIESDCAPINKMLRNVVDVVKSVKFMRDPTRGGVATTLNEVSSGRNFGIVINEDSIPISDSVKGACELLGLDPLYIANEGKALIFVDPCSEEKVLDLLGNNEYGVNAATIGEVVSENEGKVCLKTRYGTIRIVDMLYGESMPRIC